MDVVSIATRHRLARNPEMEEASTKRASLTVALMALERGTPAYRATEAARDWWGAKIRELNPGGAEIVRFPVRSEPKQRGAA